jgi:hypothetical protein
MRMEWEQSSPRISAARPRFQMSSGWLLAYQSQQQGVAETLKQAAAG